MVVIANCSNYVLLLLKSTTAIKIQSRGKIFTTQHSCYDNSDGKTVTRGVDSTASTELRMILPRIQAYISR